MLNVMDLYFGSGEEDSEVRQCQLDELIRKPEEKARSFAGRLVEAAKGAIRADGDRDNVLKYLFVRNINCAIMQPRLRDSYEFEGCHGAS